MSKTGDIQNNFEELNRELKKIQYPNKLPFKLLQSGNPEVYLPIIHYTLFKFSKYVAQFLSDNNYDLFAKNDYDFISSVFNALIKLFNYKPCLTLDSFFSKGSAENKIILCCNIIQLIQVKHNELFRKETINKKSLLSNKTNNKGYSINQINVAPKTKKLIHSVEQEYQEEEERIPSSPKFYSKGELQNEEDIYNQYEDCSNNQIQYNNLNDQVEQLESSQELSVENNKSNINCNFYSSKNEVETSSENNQMHQSNKSLQQNAMDFSALVQVINTLSNSVSQMASKVEKFKLNIEERLCKIEAEVSLIKNNQFIIENKCNCLINNSINTNNCNSNSDHHLDNKKNEQIFSFSANVHSLDFSNKNDSNENELRDSLINKPELNHNQNYNNIRHNKQLTNYEDTDRLIENVEKKFKETQKLLSQFN